MFCTLDTLCFQSGPDRFQQGYSARLPGFCPGNIQVSEFYDPCLKVHLLPRKTQKFPDPHTRAGQRYYNPTVLITCQTVENILKLLLSKMAICDRALFQRSTIVQLHHISGGSPFQVFVDCPIDYGAEAGEISPDRRFAQPLHIFGVGGIVGSDLNLSEFSNQSFHVFDLEAEQWEVSHQLYDPGNMCRVCELRLLLQGGIGNEVLRRGEKAQTVSGSSLPLDCVRKLLRKFKSLSLDLFSC